MTAKTVLTSTAEALLVLRQKKGILSLYICIYVSSSCVSSDTVVNRGNNILLILKCGAKHKQQLQWKHHQPQQQITCWSPALCFVTKRPESAVVVQVVKKDLVAPGTQCRTEQTSRCRVTGEQVVTLQLLQTQRCLRAAFCYQNLHSLPVRVR